MGKNSVMMNYKSEQHNNGSIKARFTVAHVDALIRFFTVKVTCQDTTLMLAEQEVAHKAMLKLKYKTSD
jgi:hypothetical protein